MKGVIYIYNKYFDLAVIDIEGLAWIMICPLAMERWSYMGSIERIGQVFLIVGVEGIVTKC